jgi:hypothetical protein
MPPPIRECRPRFWAPLLATMLGGRQHGVVSPPGVPGTIVGDAAGARSGRGPGHESGRNRSTTTARVSVIRRPSRSTSQCDCHWPERRAPPRSAFGSHPRARRASAATGSAPGTRRAATVMWLRPVRARALQPPRARRDEPLASDSVIDRSDHDCARHRPCRERAGGIEDAADRATRGMRRSRLWSRDGLDSPSSRRPESTANAPKSTRHAPRWYRRARSRPRGTRAFRRSHTGRSALPARAARPPSPFVAPPTTTRWLARRTLGVSQHLFWVNPLRCSLVRRGISILVRAVTGSGVRRRHSRVSARAVAVLASQATSKRARRRSAPRVRSCSASSSPGGSPRSSQPLCNE